MNATEILDTHEEMFLVYARSDQFGDLTEEGRNTAVNAYESLKQLTSDEK